MRGSLRTPRSKDCNRFSAPFPSRWPCWRRPHRPPHSASRCRPRDREAGAGSFLYHAHSAPVCPAYARTFSCPRVRPAPHHQDQPFPRSSAFTVPTAPSPRTPGLFCALVTPSAFPSALPCSDRHPSPRRAAPLLHPRSFPLTCPPPLFLACPRKRGRALALRVTPANCTVVPVPASIPHAPTPTPFPFSHDTGPRRSFRSPRLPALHSVACVRGARSRSCRRTTAGDPGPPSEQTALRRTTNPPRPGPQALPLPAPFHSGSCRSVSGLLRLTSLRAQAPPTDEE